MIYKVVAIAAAGVPDRIPVVVLNVKPDRIWGEIEYEETAPPCDDGVFGVMGAPTI